MPPPKLPPAPPPPPADDITPADLGDGPAPKKAAPPADDVAAELTRLRAENAALKGGRPGFTAGRRYRVAVQHGPTAVVEPEPGEHPHDAFRRATGVIASANPFEMHEVGDDEPIGIIDPATGRARGR